MSRSAIVELESGDAEPPYLLLEEGKEFGPIPVGRRGGWRVEAVGVLDVHAHLYFDGTDLFVQSADEMRPVIAGGAAIARVWTVLEAPCAIDLGGARLAYRRTEATHEEVIDDELLDEENNTTLVRPPPQGSRGRRSPRRARPLTPGQAATQAVRAGPRVPSPPRLSQRGFDEEDDVTHIGRAHRRCPRGNRRAR
jgi:hypothetical protein